MIFFRNQKKFLEEGPTEIWTRIAGFKVQSANHYTMGPCLVLRAAIMEFESVLKRSLKISSFHPKDDVQDDHYLYWLWPVLSLKIL